MAARALSAALVAWLLVATPAHVAIALPASPAGQGERHQETPHPGVVLRWHALGQEAGRGEVRVAGLSPASLERLQRHGLDGDVGARVLRVVVAPTAATPAHGAGLPNLWGEWSIDNGELVFRPRHVLAPGTRLVAHFDGAGFAQVAHTRRIADATLAIDTPAATSVARVLEASPGGDTIPANLLRFYIEFSHPMTLRDVERHVRLQRADGSVIETAFASPADGLWDPARRRLTLIVHPGRVKSGLGLGARLGPVLVPGETVTLAIASALTDANGAPLQADFARTWRVVEAVRVPIDPTRWVVHAPKSADAALVVHTPHALDRAVALRAVWVLDAQEAPVRGVLDLAAGERELRFRPAGGWRPNARYRLVVAAFLEDGSGNRPGRAFERDVVAPEGGQGGEVEIAFVAGGF